MSLVAAVKTLTYHHRLFTLFKPKSIDECVEMCTRHTNESEKQRQKQKHQNNDANNYRFKLYSLTRRSSVALNVQNGAIISANGPCNAQIRLFQEFLFLAACWPFSSTFKYYNLTFNFQIILTICCFHSAIFFCWNIYIRGSNLGCD